MKKIYKIITSTVLTLAISTNMFLSSAIDEYGNPISYFFVDGISYVHDDDSTKATMLGGTMNGKLETFNIPETVKNESDSKTYTITSVNFDEWDGLHASIYTIKTINISRNLEYINTYYNHMLPSSIIWKNLKTINVPIDSNLKSLSGFFNCPKLKSVYIPASVKSIGFKNCPNLKMTVSKDNPKYKMRNTRYLCSKNGKTAYEYFGKQKSVTIPKGITALYGTYSDNKYIKKVTIPSSVKTIKGYTFSNCKGLSKVIIKNEKKAPKISKKTRYNITDKVFENTKKGIKFYVKNKKVAKSLKKQLKGSGVRNAKILIGKKVVYKNVK